MGVRQGDNETDSYSSIAIAMSQVSELLSRVHRNKRLYLYPRKQWINAACDHVHCEDYNSPRCIYAAGG
jgi:hypothetical protein